MICPYNRKSETRCEQWSQEPIDENETIAGNGKTFTKYTFEMMSCEQENCGAWHNGRCCYASVSLDNE